MLIIHNYTGGRAPRVRPTRRPHRRREAGAGPGGRLLLLAHDHAHVDLQPTGLLRRRRHYRP